MRDRDLLIEFFIILGDSVGVVGGFFALYQVASEQTQVAFSLAGGVLLALAAMALVVFSTGGRSARRRSARPDPPGKWVMRGSAALFAVAAFFTFTIAIVGSYQLPSTSASEFVRQGIVIVSTALIFMVQVAVELLALKTMLEKSLPWYLAVLGPLFEFVGTGALFLHYFLSLSSQPPPDALALGGLIVGIFGVVLNLLLLGYDAIKSRRRSGESTA
jgi:hypothetical protein